MAAYKDTTSLNYEKFVQNLLNTFGVSPTTIEKMYQSPEMFLGDHNSKSLLQSEIPAAQMFDTP
jgi:endo-1,4-beta-mannosidase